MVEAVGGASVLDVGGGPGSLQQFLPDRRVVASDLSPPSRWHTAAPSLVLADGAALPFADAAFDVVVTLDTLEHVPGPRRPALLREAVRVARGWVLVVCPCATPGVADADTALLALVRHRFGEEFETVGVLTEHLTYGHPEPELIERALRESDTEVVRFPSGRLDRWLPMMVLFYDLMALGRDDPVERVQAWYNRLFYRDDLRAPSYRQAFLCRRRDAAGPALDDAVARLLPDDAAPVLDATVLEALRIGLSEELVAAVEEERVRADRLAAELSATRAEAERHATRAEAAEQQVAALEAFRQQVLSHPLLRARRGFRRLLRR